MGWPRKNEECRLYREPAGSYILVLLENVCPDGGYEAIGNVYNNSEPSLASTSVSLAYLARWGIKRVEWSELPNNWKQAFRVFLNAWKTTPRKIRGFWRVGENHAS